MSTNPIVVGIETWGSIDWEHDQFPDVKFDNATPSMPDPILYVAGVQDPESRWYDEHIYRLCQAAVRQLDPAERVKYIQAVDRYITEEAYFLQFYYPRDLFMKKPWVKEYMCYWGCIGDWSRVILEPHE